MKNLSAKFKKHATASIAALMVFWLSGVLFLFCCGTMPAQSADQEFCPLAVKGQSHCDKMKKDGGAPTFSSVSSDPRLDCCGFLPAVFDKTRKIEQSEQIAHSAAKMKVDLQKFSFVENDVQIAANYRSPLLKHHKIYIKNCIFRI